MAARAQAAETPLLRPERASDPAFAEALRGHAPDLGVVVAFGQFLPRRIRELPRLGLCINAHASLLPRYRGAAPIARALLEGEAETGISVMRVDREMDAGPVALVRSTPIGPDETTGELETRLAALAADAIAEAVDLAAEGRLSWTHQEAGAATFAPKLEREEARIDWRVPAARIALQVRAFAPKPGAFTTLEGEPLRILAARACAGSVEAAPGQVVVEGDRLRIATGEGWLEPRVLQRAGKRPLPAAEFLRGKALPVGIVLGEGTDAH